MYFALTRSRPCSVILAAWSRVPSANTYVRRQARLENEGVLSGRNQRTQNVTIPVQITFRHMESSTAVETRVRELADHLGVFSDKITSCRVVLDSPHRHSHQGKVFNVKVQLALPGEDVVVDMERPQRDGHEDVYVVLRDAFDAAKRQLQQRMSSLRGDVKRRETLS
jgi:ribosome-associated translation inhibitor RaiA